MIQVIRTRLRTPAGEAARVGDYDRERLLKRGPDVETWLGRDRVSGRAVVVRLVSGGSPTLWNRLAHEARVLGELESASVLEVAPGLLVRAYIEGLTLEERLQQGPLAVGEALELFAGLCDRLEQVHARGILHGDLKPGNLVLSSEGLVPIDFGLARLGPERLEAAGSPAYLAPEASGLIRRALGPPTDLYALGATLYHALSGQPPFVHASAREVLRAHLVEKPAPLKCLPKGLDELVRRLLAKEPGERYQAAATVAAHLRVIAAGGTPAVGAAGRSEPALAGRERELERLVGELAGEGGLVLLEGEPGGGKSRLLDELDYRAQAQGLPVLRAQADTGITPRPLALLGGLLAAPAEEDGDDVDRVADRLAQELEKLAPAVVLLDDVQWADGLSLEVLSRWSRLAQRRLLVVASRRAGFPEPGWGVAFRLVLEPLGREPLRALAESMRGSPLQEEEVDRLAEITGGNPFLAAETMRGEGLETTLRGAHFLGRRLEGLEPDAAGLLRAAAVLGRTCSLSVLQEVYPFRWEALAEARSRGLLWQEPDGETLRLPHDRIREALLAQLADHERHALHLRAAEHALSRDDDFGTAYHFSEAGDDERAAPYALRAARAARSRSDLPTAGEYYLRALRRPAEGEVLLEACQALTVLGLFENVVELLASELPDPRQDLRRLTLLGRTLNEADRLADSQARFEELIRRGVLLPVRVSWRICKVLVTPRPRFGERPSPEVERRLRLLLDHSQSSAHSLRVPVALEGLAWAAELAARYPESATSLEAFALLANVQCQFGLGKTARRTAQLAERRARQLPDLQARGKCLARIASAWCTSAPLQPTLDRFLEADTLLGRDYWESGTTRFYLGPMLLATGQFRLLERLGRDSFGKSREQNRQTVHRCTGLAMWALATGGAGLGELLAAELAERTDSPMREISLGVALGTLYPAQAAERLVFKAWSSPIFMMYADAWGAMYARQAAEASPLVPGEARRRYLRIANRCVRRGLRLARSSYWALLPHCLREAGLLAFHAGRPARARALLAESLYVAEALEARYDAAVTRQERARLGALLDWPEADEGPEAETELRHLGAHWRLPAEWTQSSTVPPLDRLLEQGQEVLRGARPRTEGEPQVVNFLNGLHRAVAEREAAASEQRAAEEALETSRRRFEALFQATGVGLAWRDQRGEVRLANPTMRETLRGAELPWPLPEEGPLPGGGWGRWLVAETVDGHLITLVPAEPGRRRQMAALQLSEDRLRAAVLAEIDGPIRALAEELKAYPELARHTAALEGELRRIPASLAELPAPEGARASLSECVESFTARTGIPVELTLPSDFPRLPDLSGQALLRIVDEALANVQRHAQARHVEVRITTQGDSIRGLVRDDGRGLSGEAAPLRLGLKGMRFRAELAGGEWQISGDQSGTRVEFRLPTSV